MGSSLRPLRRLVCSDDGAAFNEETVVRAWADRAYGAANLETVGGVPVQVVYPGRRNTDSGPDFLDALLVIGDGPLCRGDVEVHQRAADWFAHGHSGNPAYSGVVLHVVAHAGGRASIAGAPVLELPLTRDWELSSERGASRAFQTKGSGGAHSLLAVSLALGQEETLEVLGDARLEARAAALEGDVAAVGAEQALYEGLMGGLGYSKNVTPFQELGRRVPFSLLREMVTGRRLDSDQRAIISGLLFGVAGMLPSQRGNAAKGGRILDDYMRATEEAWARLGGMETLALGSWRIFRVRPENHPLRRIGAAVALVGRWFQDDLITQLRRVVIGEEAPARVARLVVETLRIGPEGYWASHRDFGVERGGNASALVGTGRAREMAVSVALPFLLALADWDGDGRLEASVRAVYAALPMPPENAMARWAESHFAERSTGDESRDRGGRGTARRQQGLLHLARG